MADERVMSIIEFIKNKYPNPDLSAFPDKFAVQIELIDIPGGVFYMEVLNGELSIEPYEYNDRDLSVKISKSNLEKLINGKLKAESALITRKIIISGNMSKALLIKKLLK
ncbi:SCP2 sterol-binding domain-containing protein [Porcipelethomonas ammoniilytica]|uniref:SCP2 sterol-binding domain-containing protein n=1 Tax=Porcipelethomonas ammoniilytica TaxID=2981722 RepID=UPI0008230C4A|nr:SCP2 sterol-binding domain-containing protein [Porcipelethomonas ammoniilytica]MCU6719442.1 SCP2 sterol-binding domain-containing protein [Porcipelethomonas ammoniilytica]SCI80816.1 Putative sterol carrier protein [uncultured Ruminococcus sp.]